jgi:hypothetical protein
MKLSIRYQETYSRGQLLLRTFFGAFYILIPHAFAMLFPAIWSAILSFAAFWVILFTGKYPQAWFEYQVGLMRWSLRVNARVYNLLDGYPSFGRAGDNDGIELEVPYPATLSRGKLILRALFGWLYVFIPHGFLLFFRALWLGITFFLSFWIVLFTGRMPESFHENAVGYFRWTFRLGLYVSNMTDTYPPFNGKE